VQILGPVRITTADGALELRAARERQLLALLAIQHDTVVTVERLVDEIWDGAPTDSAVAALRVHVSRLRKTLSTAQLEHLLETRPTGYLLRLGDEGTLDADCFETAASLGRAQLDDDPAGAAVTLRRALSMWEGPVLLDVPSMLSVIAARRRLDELRLVTTEDCLQAELDVGRHREVLAELEALTHEHPLRERFCALRMRALYRSGRQPEALRAFQEHRSVVVDEVGLEPSGDLTALERLIVAQDPLV
jgi:DNA-binding SARP family transcriptional activator